MRVLFSVSVVPVSLVFCKPLATKICRQLLNATYRSGPPGSGLVPQSNDSKPGNFDFGSGKSAEHEELLKKTKREELLEAQVNRLTEKVRTWVAS